MLDFEQLVVTDDFYILGFSKGQAAEKRAVIYAMLKKGLASSLIAEITELPLKTIKVMKKEQKRLKKSQL